MTPIDVQDHDWPDGRVVWLLAAIAGLGIAAFFVRDAAAWLAARWRGPTPTVRPIDDTPRDLVPRAQLDAALAALTRTQIALAAERDARARRAILTGEDTARLDWIEREAVDVRACYDGYVWLPDKNERVGVPAFRVFTEASGGVKRQTLRKAIDDAMCAARAELLTLTTPTDA